MLQIIYTVIPMLYNKESVLRKTDWEERHKNVNHLQLSLVVQL